MQKQVPYPGVSTASCLNIGIRAAFEGALRGLVRGALGRVDEAKIGRAERLCVGGSLLRLGTRVPGSDGAAIWGPDLGAQGGWSPGDARTLQVLYRDPTGPCAAGSNLTNALAVTFGP